MLHASSLAAEGLEKFVTIVTFYWRVKWQLKKISGKVYIELEAYQAVIYNKKGNAVTARRRGRLIAEESNAGHC